MTDERFQLYDPEGRRKYLSAQKRAAFLTAAEHAPREVRTLCLVLAYSGCRISEALALTVDRVDLAAHTIIFETLNKRGRGVYRAVPVPPAVNRRPELRARHQGSPERQRRRGRAAFVAVLAHKRLALCAASSKPGRTERPASQPQGPAARLRRPGHRRRYPP